MKLIMTFSVLLLSLVSNAGELVYECHSKEERQGLNVSVYIQKDTKNIGLRPLYAATITNGNSVLFRSEAVTNSKPDHVKDRFVSKDRAKHGYAKILWDFEIYELEDGTLQGALNTYVDSELDKKVKDLDIHCPKDIENPSSRWGI